MTRALPQTNKTIHKQNKGNENSSSSHAYKQLHVCNGQRRWLHGTADCVAACAHKAPRSQTRITSTMTERRHSRAKSKRRLGTASGTGLLWLAPQKSTSHTQLGTYGPGYFIVPWCAIISSLFSRSSLSHLLSLLPSRLSLLSSLVSH